MVTVIINLTTFIMCINFITESINVYYILLRGKEKVYSKEKNKQPKEKVVWAFSSAIKIHATHKTLELLMLLLFTTRDS